MDSPDGFPRCEFSAPEGARAMAELFDETDLCGARNIDDTLQYDFSYYEAISHGPIALDYNQDVSNPLSCEQTQELLIAVSGLRPTINTQQPLCPLDTSGGYLYAQEQHMSPTQFIVTTPEGQNNPGFDAGFDLAGSTGFSLRTPSLDSGTTAPTPSAKQPVYFCSYQSSFLCDEGQQLSYDQDPAWAPLSATNVANISSTLDPNIHYPSSPGSRRSSFDLGDIGLAPNTHFPPPADSRRSSFDLGYNNLEPNTHYTGFRRTPGDLGDDASSVRSNKRARDDDDALSVRSVRTQNDASSIRSVRTQNDASSIRSKRTPMIKGGFPCKFRGCTVIKDRECDERKHYKTAHSAEQERPYGCKLCPKRFHYPKDIKRHMAQTHKIFDDETPENERPPKIKTPSKRRFSLASLASMVQKLQLWHKEPAPSSPAEQILVTADQVNFRKISLKGVETSEALMQKIGSTFGVSVEDALLRCCGSGRLGKCVDRTHLMATVRKAVKAGTTLELLFTPKSERSNGDWKGMRECY